MRLLIFGHISDTGFGTVTRELATRLLEQHDVRILAVNHRGDPIRGPLAGRVWPTNMFGEAFGGNLSAAAIAGPLWSKLDPTDHWEPDQTLVISDVSGLLSFMGKVTPEIVELWRSKPVWHYCPIEGDNLPPTWREVWQIVRPVAMSDYGARVISEHIGRSVPRIYHGVNTERFRPVSFGSPIRIGNKVLTTREACKDHFGVAGKKVILRADRNATRKFYYKLIEAFVSIAQAEPDAVLLLHCQAVDIEGMDLIAEVQRTPEDVRDRIWFTGMHDTFVGLDLEGMAALYNAADVYVSTTGGEGFGLTLAESLACETPVVVTDWAAEREVVGDGGVLIPPLRDAYGDTVRYHSGYGMDWAVPDARAFVEPTLRLLKKPHERTELGRRGRRHIARFSWDTATSEFLSLFEEADAAAA